MPDKQIAHVYCAMGWMTSTYGSDPNFKQWVDRRVKWSIIIQESTNFKVISGGYEFHPNGLIVYRYDFNPEEEDYRKFYLGYQSTGYTRTVPTIDYLWDYMSKRIIIDLRED